jgi:hypothetical protein
VPDPHTPTAGPGRGRQTVRITFNDKPSLTQSLQLQNGIDPPETNEEIPEKWKLLAGEVIDKERMMKIESLVLELESCQDITLLRQLMAGIKKNPIAWRRNDKYQIALYQADSTYIL